ncbi:MAG: ABC transporter permease subunit/CPBP intramembrane protease [Thermoguttaceae bacterium]
MNLKNVKLILSREVRDQLRDRRTLFMMFVLPILLYPLLGMLFLQIQQFVQDKPVRVLVVGAEDYPDLPPLFENESFAESLFSDPKDTRLLEVHFPPNEPDDPGSTADPFAEAQRAVRAREYDAAIYFPEGFGEELQRFRRAIEERVSRAEEISLADAQGSPLKVPNPMIIHDFDSTKSMMAYDRLNVAIRAWRELVGESNLAAGGIPASAASPFDPQSSPVGDPSASRSASMWSKILPVLMLIWALTGAFYPAVDLCAGEKERGTLETLLCSPAERSEIVLGKLGTIMLFSMVTAVLNLASVGLTGWLVFGGRPEFGPPSSMAILWLMIALVPIAAVFSALCLALAAFARSTKEGQYYLMPLLLITMPLAVLPMAPAVELNLGNALIPISGLVLLLRSAMEGNTMLAIQYLPVVVGVQLLACMLSIRWAIDQFNSESVLFRESERLDVGLWLRHLLRDRRPTPTVAGALSCGVLILVLKFFTSLSASPMNHFGDLARSTVITQLVVIAVPAIFMTFLLTSSARETLLLMRPAWRAVPAAALLALMLHPAVNALQVVVQRLYPISENVREALQTLTKMFTDAPFWQLALVLAVLPAVCEEFAFRGFLLSGFRHLGHKWRAIVFSALFFGLAHGILQQSLIACVVGVVLGYVAVQTGSIFPCMVFHVLHNTLALAMTRINPEVLGWPLLRRLMVLNEEGDYVYSWPTIVGGLFASLLILLWFRRLRYQRSSEEKLQDAIDRGLHSDEEPEIMVQSLAAPPQ